MAHAVSLVMLAVVVAFASAEPSRAASEGELVRAELIAEPKAVTAGEPFWVGLRLRIKDGWHVYWRNPGDSGEAVAIDWELPPGFAAGAIAWPTPQRIPVAHLVNYGYEGETVLLARITPPATLDPSMPLALEAGASWLVCEKECVPGEARLSLTLPAADRATSPSTATDRQSVFDAARRALPHASPWPARMAVGPRVVTLAVDAAGLQSDRIRSAYFFPNEPTLLRHAAPQYLSFGADGLVLRLERSALSTAEPADRGGVLVIEEALDGAATARQAFTLNNVGAGSGAADAVSALMVLQAMLLAVLGGVVLNLMPCVFPVLSVKVLALVEHVGATARDLRRHGVAYTAGVLAAFLVLAGVLLGLRAAGQEVGWGFQLQSPVAVALLAYVLAAMALSLSGVFHLGTSLQGAGLGLARRPGLTGSFFAGGLAAVVATPCTAPFMAAAVGFALAQPAAVALPVIMALGLGLALPFLALTLMPHLLDRLPHPGPWMETLRQVLAFPLYATVAWLIWVLAQQVGPTGLFAALVGLVLVGLGAWSFNLAQTSNGWGRRAAGGLVAACVTGLALAVVGLGRDPVTPAAGAVAQTAADGQPAERFTLARLDEIVASGRPVFVNLTAAWCITCLVNERTALSSEAVRSAFATRNIAYLKGDWTRRDPEITRLLEKHGRSGVPLYLLYSGKGEPVVLPQILTAAMVLGEIDRIAPPRQKAALSTSAEE